MPVFTSRLSPSLFAKSKLLRIGPRFDRRDLDFERGRADIEIATGPVHLRVTIESEGHVDLLDNTSGIVEVLLIRGIHLGQAE